MARWIPGKGLLRRWGIQDFELLEYVKEGYLEPHSKFGRSYKKSVLPYAPGDRISEKEIEEEAGRMMQGMTVASSKMEEYLRSQNRGHNLGTIRESWNNTLANGVVRDFSLPTNPTS